MSIELSLLISPLTLFLQGFCRHKGSATWHKDSDSYILALKIRFVSLFSVSLFFSFNCQYFGVERRGLASSTLPSMSRGLTKMSKGDGIIV